MLGWIAPNILRALGYFAHWFNITIWRKSPVHWCSFANMDLVMKQLSKQKWKLGMGGLFFKHIGIGFFFGRPPVFMCETCRQEFKTETACIEHEKESGHYDE